MSARRVVVLVSAVALALTGTQAVPAYVGSAPPAAADDGGQVFVNEIHYAGEGVDSGEFVELAGPSGTDLTGWEVVLYDGATGTPYSSTPLAETLPANGTTVVHYPLEGIHDDQGAVALVDGAGRLVDFVSWDGLVTGTSGPADDATSEDIGARESDTTPQDASLQLVGEGSSPADFRWTGPATGSPGATNDGEILTTLNVTEATRPGLMTDELEPGDVIEKMLAPTDIANEILIEGESLVPTTVGTPTTSLASNGTLVWSGNRQLRMEAAAPFDTSTLTFQLPAAGRWVVSADLTRGPNFGLVDISIDDDPAITFDSRFGTSNRLSYRFPLGTHDLDAGTHTLTLMPTAPNPATGQLRVGLDLLRFRRLPDSGNLTLSPAPGAAVRGKVPVYGWSTEIADDLTVQVDHQDVADWAALGDTATLFYEARGIDAGPAGARPLDGISVRGQKIILNYDVSGPGTQFAVNGVQISGELLHPGDNTIAFFAGADPALGPNLDDFTVRNMSLLLADGTIIKDPTRPDSTLYLLGDDAVGALPERTWTFTIPPAADPHPRYTPAAGYLIDTQGMSDGHHFVTLTSDGPSGVTTYQSKITVDNDAPTVSGLIPADGTTAKGTFTVNATVADVGDRTPTVDARLDGTPVQLGASFDTDDLADGPHTFSVVVTDAAGSHAEASTTFTTVGETPDAPQLVGPSDGGTVTGGQAQLAVTATDPAGERLHVDFLQAAPGGPPVAGRAGSAEGDVPAPALGAGDAVNLSAAAASDDTYVDSAPSGDAPYQRYDVKVSKVRGAKYVDLSWEGRVAADRDAVLSVWDVGLQKWKEVVSAHGSDTQDTTLVGTTRLGPVIDGDVVHVLVQALDEFADVPSTPVTGFQDPSSYQFAIAWMSDTQYLTQGGADGTKPFGENYQAMTDWIMRNADQRKIIYTAHTGDIINNWQLANTDEPRARREFVYAGKVMSTLEGQSTDPALAGHYMPYGVLPGNHDNRTGGNNDLYNEYFGPARFEALSALAPKGEDGEGFYGGPWRPGDNQNHYDLIEANGLKLIFVDMGYIVRPDEIAWANEVLAAHRDRAAIVATHSYLLPSNAPNAVGSELTTADGVDLFNQVVVPNPNVFLTLSGHTNGMGLNIKRDVGGVKGRTVVEMLSNQQFFEDRGLRTLAYLRLLQVNLAKGQIAVDTYDPSRNNFNSVEFDIQPGRRYLESADDFVVPVDLPTRLTTLRTDAIGLALRGTTVIGSADIASGQQASTTWRGLARGTKYSWYARVTDPTGAKAESSVFSFTST